MICPSCGYDNIEGVDRCEECLTSLLKFDVPQADSAHGLARSVMEDDLNQLESEFLAVAPDAPLEQVISKLKAARLGCALVLDGGKLIGIFTERDLLNKATGEAAHSLNTPVRKLMSANPEVLRDTDSVATTLNKMSMGRYRHIPVAKADGS